MVWEMVWATAPTTQSGVCRRRPTPAPHMPPLVPPANKGRWYTKNVNRRTGGNVTSKPAAIPKCPQVSRTRQGQLRIHRPHRRNRRFRLVYGQSGPNKSLIFVRGWCGIRRVYAGVGAVGCSKTPVVSSHRWTSDVGSRFGNGVLKMTSDLREQTRTQMRGYRQLRADSSPAGPRTVRSPPLAAFPVAVVVRLRNAGISAQNGQISSGVMNKAKAAQRKGRQRPAWAVPAPDAASPFVALLLYVGVCIGAGRRS